MGCGRAAVMMELMVVLLVWDTEEIDEVIMGFIVVVALFSLLILNISSRDFLIPDSQWIEGGMITPRLQTNSIDWALVE